jgi:hypothetical protein
LSLAVLIAARYTQRVQNIPQITGQNCHSWRREILELMKDTKKRSRKKETEMCQQHMTDKLRSEGQSRSHMAVLTMFIERDGVAVLGMSPVHTPTGS